MNPKPQTQAELEVYWKYFHPKPRTCSVDGNTENEAPHLPTLGPNGETILAAPCGGAGWIPWTPPA